MRVVNAHGLALGLIEYQLHLTLADDGLVHLAGLIALGQIGVEVVLAFEQRGLGNLGVDGEAELHRHGDRALVEHRQHARQAEIDGTRLRVGLGAESGGGPGEDFRLGRELNVDFQPDDGFPLH